MQTNNQQEAAPNLAAAPTNHNGFSQIFERTGIWEHLSKETLAAICFAYAVEAKTREAINVQGDDLVIAMTSITLKWRMLYDAGAVNDEPKVTERPKSDSAGHY